MIAHRHLAKLLYAPFPDLIWKGNEPNTIYLTFDDGPFDGITDQIISILGAQKVPATFFVSGEALQNCQSLPDYSGHEIGNHLYHHTPQIGFNRKTITEEIQRTNDLISAKLNRNAKYCRPPYGVFSGSYLQPLRKNNQQLVLWTLMANDFKWSAERVLKHLKTQTRSGDIIVCHDSPKAAECIIEVLPRFIKHCLGRGLRFSLLDVNGEW